MHLTLKKATTKPAGANVLQQQARYDHDRHELRPAVFQRAEGESESCPAGQSVGVSQVGDRIWLVSFMQYDLGYFDDETCRLEPIQRNLDDRFSDIPML